jgi:signal transduction histidine kinase
LKTPITTVKLYLQVLEKMAKQNKDRETAGHLSKLEIQIDKLTRLVSDLLDLSKIQAGKLELSMKSFDLDDMVGETAEMLQRTVESHLFVLRLGSKRRIRGDRDRLSQVLINFLTNAVKYSPNGDTVIIKTGVKGGKAIVSVTDQGIGIPEEYRAKIFDRFFRIEGDRERTYSGFGIGLYISAEIVNRHGGEICVESMPGKGSTFSFSLPLAAEKKAKAKKR